MKNFTNASNFENITIEDILNMEDPEVTLSDGKVTKVKDNGELLFASDYNELSLEEILNLYEEGLTFEIEDGCFTGACAHERLVDRVA